MNFRVLAGLGLTLALWTGGCATMGTLARTAPTLQRAARITRTVAEGFRPFTPEEEDAIGRSVFLDLLARFPPVQDDSLQIYATSILMVLAAHSSQPVTFRGWRAAVVQADVPNAFSTPGGYVAVTLPLVKLTESEDELAAVLAHEVAHVTLKHGLNSVRRARKASIVKVLGAEFLDLNAYQKLLLDVATDLSHLLLERGFSRQEEMQADSVAVDLLSEAGYDPTALIRVLEKIADLEQPSGPGILRSHPPAPERIARLQRRVFSPVSIPSARQERFARYTGPYR